MGIQTSMFVSENRHLTVFQEKIQCHAPSWISSRCVVWSLLIGSVHIVYFERDWVFLKHAILSASIIFILQLKNLLTTFLELATLSSSWKKANFMPCFIVLFCRNMMLKLNNLQPSGLSELKKCTYVLNCGFTVFSFSESQYMYYMKVSSKLCPDDRIKQSTSNTFGVIEFLFGQ